MNILILISSLHFGGAEKQAVTDANLLSDRGNQVTIAYNKEGQLSTLLNHNIRQVKLFTSNQILLQFHLLCFLMKNRFDVIHAHMFWAEKVIVLPGVLTGHGIIFNEHGLGLWRKWYHRLIMRLASLGAKRVICSCKLNEKIRLETELIPRSKLVTIYNSITTYDYSNKDKTEFFTIGFVGRFHAVKRLPIFIQLAKYCKQSQMKVLFLLVGDGEEFDNVKKLVIENELLEYFEFSGYKSNPIDEYRKMDIFILPSRLEAFSVALLEAGSFGLPLLAFDVGGNSEIVQDNVTGFLIEDGNVLAMFDKINLLYNDSKLLYQLSLSTKSHIVNNFSNNNRIKQLEALYNGIKN